MKAAQEGLPERQFEVPPGVAMVRIDAASGMLAGAATPGRLEPFLEGTAPTAQAPPQGQVDPDRVSLEAGRREGLLAVASASLVRWPRRVCFREQRPRRIRCRSLRGRSAARWSARAPKAPSPSISALIRSDS